MEIVIVNSQVSSHHYSLSRPIAFCCLVAVFVLFLSVSAASAKDIYIAQNSAGNASGGDCTNSHPVSWFNGSGNWGSGLTQIGPGTIVHLCGTITSQLSIQGSGTSGNVIEILFETGANVTVAACATSCLDIGGNSYILVDGGTPCGWNVASNTSEGTCNGVIQATANGSALANHIAGQAINASGGSNIEIRNLGMYNVWVPNGSDNNLPNTNPACITLTTENSVSVHDSKCHDAQSFMNGPFFSSISNYDVYNNEVYNVNGTFTIVSGGTTTFTNVHIRGNRFHDWAAWDDPADAFHHDGIYFFSSGGNCSGTIANWQIYNNIWNGQLGQHPTAYWYSDGTVVLSNLQIFNNVFAPTDAPAGGSGYVAIAACSGDSHVENNTFIGQPGGGIACLQMNNTQSNVTVQNNLFQGCVTFMTSWGNVSYAPGGLNYNAYSQCNSANCWFWNTQFYGDFASWKSASVGDANGNFSTTGANLDANYKPQSGSIAIDTGVNLAHLGIVALNNDAANLPRPALAGGAWTTGAYSAGQSPAINPPSNLTVLSVN